jgi:hypothetical protein
MPAKLVAAAFPSLQRLELVGVSLNWKDLQALTSCPQLSYLHVQRCALPAIAPATHPLAALASLKEVHVLWTSSTIVQGLTQLTSLCLCSTTDTLQHILRSLEGLQQLQELTLMGKDRKLPAALVAQLLSAAPNLAGLTLHTVVGQQAFDALLAHATQLTRLACHLDLSESRSQSACSWKELVVLSSASCTPRTLAYLPLHSLSRVSFGTCALVEQFGIPSACPYLRCNSTPADIQAALANLGTCPAWQASGPCVRVSLISQEPQQTVKQLLSALAGLADRKIQLLIDAAQLQVTEEVIERMGATLGHSLTHLILAACSIPYDFWPAVWRHLPGLQSLRISSGVSGAISSADIAAFCSHATRPLSLRLGRGLYDLAKRAEQLEQQCRTWGVPQVTVTVLDGFLKHPWAA